MPDQGDHKVVISGWLTKKAVANTFSSGKTWTRRFFVLSGGVLRYYGAEGDNSPRGELPISPNSAVRVLDSEQSLSDHGLAAKMMGKRLFAFHAIPCKGEKDIAKSAFVLESETSGSGAFYTLVPIRPRSRGGRRSLRTLPGASLRPPLAFNPRPRRLSTPTDAFELHPDSYTRG